MLNDFMEMISEVLNKANSTGLTTVYPKTMLKKKAREAKR